MKPIKWHYRELQVRDVVFSVYWYALVDKKRWMIEIRAWEDDAHCVLYRGAVSFARFDINKADSIDAIAERHLQRLITQIASTGQCDTQVDNERARVALALDRQVQ